ncbi:MAG: DUF4271 domain-containing protein [Flavobacterium sp.]|jgi:hypothetical protein|uniref:DUF4271 domain-containing protein n=1 Tax=Flavobacterium sp. TaxID=239 RepID=UPI001B6CE896|nr:DUF4271 domain-containing protein [Flavobacterium sp.]MBP9848867.1 DUF4271 domain-containing protein [Flavobacterium sp.]TAF11904.1 MAG: DUF4271 domain-containing protein [Flavobacteriia bacterium]WRH72219.1 MAG: DUF4271 domain-containing protein [Flavobacterium sp.]
MLAIQLHDRIIESKDWATILFMVCLAIIAVNKTISSVRFNEFVRLAYSDKYTKIYRDSSNLMSGFTISMFVLQLISFSFFTLLVLNQFNKAEKTDLIVYIQILTFLSVFILSKYLIEKIISTAFKIEEFSEQFNLLKVNYRAYFGFILLPVNIILYYNSLNSNWFFWALLITLISINIITYLVVLKLYQNLLLRKIFYFILYLCTLEIAPYYFIYNWFTKN